MVMLVLLFKSLSSSSCFLMMLMVLSMGMDVNKAVTSYDMMHSSSSILMFLMLSRKSLLLWTWLGDFPMRGLSIFASSFAVS